MAHNTDAPEMDDGDEDAPELARRTVESAGDIISILDEDTEEEYAEIRAERIFEVMKESGASLLVLKSSWHGNEFLGDWYSLVFAHIDFETGKAVHLSEAINADYPMRMVGKLQRERDSYDPHERSLERYEERAFKKWEAAASEGTNYGGPTNMYLTDEYCPKSAIKEIVSAPVREDHLVLSDEGQRRGSLDEADLVIRKTVMHEYKSRGRTRREEKFAVEGETFEAFLSANLKNILPFMPVEEEDGSIREPGTKHSFNGDFWVIAMDGLPTFVQYATELGFTVSVHSDYEESLDN